MSIYTGQRIPLSTTFTDDDGVVIITGATIRYDYWKPGNSPPLAASGSVVGSVVNGAAGEAEGSILAVDNDLAGTWYVQGNAIIGSDEWPECSTKFKVLDRGKVCSG